jgi:hypothetical protein
VVIYWDTPLNINLNVNYEKQDCKTGIVCVWSVLVMGGGWIKETKYNYMVDGLHIPIWNRTKKPLAIALSETRKGVRGRDDGCNVQYNSNWIFTMNSAPPCNEYILVKIDKKRKLSLKKGISL